LEKVRNESTLSAENYSRGRAQGRADNQASQEEVMAKYDTDVLDAIGQPDPVVESWARDFDDIADASLDLVESLLCERLESAPKYFTLVFRETDLVMYRGMGAVLGRAMAFAWPTVRDASGLYGTAKQAYLYRGFLATLGAAGEAPGRLDWDGWRRTHPAELFVEEMDDVEADRRFVEIFSGAAQPDIGAPRLEELDWQHDQGPLFELGAGFGRHLFEDRGWPGSRALLAADELLFFLTYVEQHDCRGEVGRDKRARHLRRGLREATLVAPDPFVLVEYIIDGSDTWSEYRPHAMGALAMAAAPWAQWLATQGLVDEALAQGICRQIERDWPLVSEYLVRWSGDPTLARDLASVQ
jgi:hypothetical protein